ncbi:MAG: chemotaxis protein CheB [Desulfobaccales bacterium]
MNQDKSRSSGRQVCIILSGNGSDGTLGPAGSLWHRRLVLVHDPATAIYNGMPMRRPRESLNCCPHKLKYCIGPPRLQQMKCGHQRATLLLCRGLMSAVNNGLADLVLPQEQMPMQLLV